MEAVFPSSASALCRGRRVRRAEGRGRRRTAPVTFAEIKELDEEEAEGEPAGEGEGSERRRRPDLLEERLGRQFAEFRRRRARPDTLRELSPAPTTAAGGALHRADSLPTHDTPHTSITSLQ